MYDTGDVCPRLRKIRTNETKYIKRRQYYFPYICPVGDSFSLVIVVFLEVSGLDCPGTTSMMTVETCAEHALSHGPEYSAPGRDAPGPAHQADKQAY